MCLFGASSSIAQSIPLAEHIEDFNSEIIIKEDGSILVTEKIRVYATGNFVKRGIYRDFPTKYKDNAGLNHTVTFDVLEVLKNGLKEEYHTENQSNGVRLYIGNANIFLATGFYDYTIKYETKGQLGFFEDHDELYFNITGNDWEFPIKRAVSTIELPSGMDWPSGMKNIQREAFTGFQGSKETNYDSGLGFNRLSGRITASFETTKSLGPQEGLTIVVGWPKGYVTPPDISEKVAQVASANITEFLGLIIFLVALFYCVIIWYLKGRDPKMNVVIAEYDAPNGLSPAAVRYINRIGYDNKCLSVSIVSMAVKGFLKIKEEAGKFTIIKLTDTMEKLSPDEVLLASQFFAGERKEFKFDTSRATTISKTIAKHVEVLAKSYSGSYFKNNYKYTVIPCMLGILFLLIGFLKEDGAGFFLVWLIIWNFPVFFIVTKSVVPAFKTMTTSNGDKLAAIGKIALAIPFMLGGVIATIVLGVIIGYAFTLLTVLFIILLGTFINLIKARTSIGTEAQRHILGLKKYLTLTEERRYEADLHKDIPVSLSVYEKYLPYAIALDVEPIWTGRFKDEIEKSLQVLNEDKNQSLNNLMWYSSTSNFSANAFSGAIGSSLTSTITSSAIVPGSRSGFSSGGGGFSGGGSSGGGGGGGGGGGW